MTNLFPICLRHRVLGSGQHNPSIIISYNFNDFKYNTYACHLYQMANITPSIFLTLCWLFIPMQIKCKEFYLYMYNTSIVLLYFGKFGVLVTEYEKNPWKLIIVTIEKELEVLPKHRVISALVFYDVNDVHQCIQHYVNKWFICISSLLVLTEEIPSHL